MRAHGVDVRLGANVEEILRGDGRPGPRAVRLDGGRRGAGRPRGLRDRRRAQHRSSSRAPGSRSRRAARSRWTTRCEASAPDVWAAGDCANVTWADGSRRPEQLWYTARDQGRLAARVDARRRGRLPPRHLVQLGEVLRPRVDDGRLRCRRSLDWDNTPARPAARGADAGSSACPAVREPADRREGRPRRRLQHARLALEPRAAPRVDPRAAQPRLGARAPARGPVRRGVHADASGSCREAGGG